MIVLPIAPGIPRGTVRPPSCNHSAEQHPRQLAHAGEAESREEQGAEGSDGRFFAAEFLHRRAAGGRGGLAARLHGSRRVAKVRH